jgi:hypothetical protein
MSAMSDYLERQLASHIFGSGTYTKPSGCAVALTSNVCVDADTGSLTVGAELANANGYARQSVPQGFTNWKDPVGTDGIETNMTTITFPKATGNQGWISGVAILDSIAYGGGNMICYAALTTPKLISTNDQFILSSGDMSWTFQ